MTMISYNHRHSSVTKRWYRLAIVDYRLLYACIVLQAIDLPWLHDVNTCHCRTAVAYDSPVSWSQLGMCQWNRQPWSRICAELHWMDRFYHPMPTWSHRWRRRDVPHVYEVFVWTFEMTTSNAAMFVELVQLDTACSMPTVATSHQAWWTNTKRLSLAMIIDGSTLPTSISSSHTHHLIGVPKPQ